MDNDPNVLLYPRSDHSVAEIVMVVILEPLNAISKSDFDYLVESMPR